MSAKKITHINGRSVKNGEVDTPDYNTVYDNSEIKNSEEYEGYPNIYAYSDAMSERRRRQNGYDEGRTMAKLDRKPISWLLEPYIPANSVTILQGDGGVGKSSFAIYLAGLVTTEGSILDTFRVNPKNSMDRSVILFSPESDDSDLVSRADVIEMDQERVIVFIGNKSMDIKDEQSMSRIIKENDCAMLVIDPLLNALGPTVDSNKAEQVGKVIEGLASVAKNTNCAIVLIHHTKKSAGRNVHKNDGIGSANITNTARSVLNFVSNPNVDGQFFVIPTKSNKAKSAPTLLYEFGEHGECIAQEILHSVNQNNFEEFLNYSKKLKPVAYKFADFLETLDSGKYSNQELVDQFFEKTGVALKSGREIRSILNNSFLVELEVRGISLVRFETSKIEDGIKKSFRGYEIIK